MDLTEVRVPTYGIGDNEKQIIETIIHEQNIGTPKLIHVYLTLNQRELNVIDLPDLSQVQSYIKYHRVKIGNENNLEGVIEDRLRIFMKKTNHSTLATKPLTIKSILVLEATRIIFI